MPSSIDYGDLVAGKLAARLASGTTSGATVTAQSVNGSTITWPTGAHRLKLYRKTRVGVEFETIGVASASQSGSTVTLGTLTRQMSMTDGSTFSSGGSGRTFPANTDVYLAWDVFDAERTMKDDKVNTLTGAGAIRGSSTTVPLVRFNNVTTSQRNAMSAANGDMVYDTDLGEFYQYKGGAWAAVGDTGTSDGSTTVAGKFEEATVAEQGSATATGGTGARLVPAVANLVKTSSGAGDENKIAVLNSAGTFNIGFIATGTPTGAKFVRDDGTLQTPSSSNYVKVVYLAASSSSALSNPTSMTSFDTHTYTIPANDLTASVWYEVEGVMDINDAAGSGVVFAIKLGSTAFGGNTFSPTTGNKVKFRSIVGGTAAAGAAVSVRCGTELTGNANKTLGDYTANNVATNGTLAITVALYFLASNGSNSATLQMCSIKKISSSAF